MKTQIIEIADKLNAKVSFDRPGYPEALRTFEERRIDWKDKEVNKAIIIQPNFERYGVNSELWNFKLVAWDTGNGRVRKNSWTKYLVSEQKFLNIENSIKELLELGVKTLNIIDKKDLEPIGGTYLFLDLDGVLITTPSWKADEIEEDGYSKFNTKCIENFNKLLGAKRFQIWLSSSRRMVKTLEEFDQIFRNREINGRIAGFLPLYDDCKNRKEEILKFITEKEITKFIILDDDNSLNSLEEEFKCKLVKTNYLLGFREADLKKAFGIIEKRTKHQI